MSKQDADNGNKTTVAYSRPTRPLPAIPKSPADATGRILVSKTTTPPPPPACRQERKARSRSVDRVLSPTRHGGRCRGNRGATMETRAPATATSADKRNGDDDLLWPAPPMDVIEQVSSTTSRIPPHQSRQQQQQQQQPNVAQRQQNLVCECRVDIILTFIYLFMPFNCYGILILKHCKNKEGSDCKG